MGIAKGEHSKRLMQENQQFAGRLG